MVIEKKNLTEDAKTIFSSIKHWTSRRLDEQEEKLSTCWKTQYAYRLSQNAVSLSQKFFPPVLELKSNSLGSRLRSYIPVWLCFLSLSFSCYLTLRKCMHVTFNHPVSILKLQHMKLKKQNSEITKLHLKNNFTYIGLAPT